MYDLHSINLFNFRSYRGEHDFVFPTEAGLYYLSGENHEQPLLGSNGAGKSTFLDAITWILYGRTTRGLKAGEVITWGANTCHGTLELTVGKRLTVKRSQKPNAIFLNGNPVDQDELDKHLILNFESFLCAVLNPQYGQSFFEMPAAAKLTLFSDIMKLDYWIEQSDKATKAVITLNNDIDHFEGAVITNNENIKFIVEDIKVITESYDRFDQNKKVRVASKKAEITALSNKLVSMEDKVATITEATYSTLHRHEEMRDIWLSDIKKYAAEVSELNGSIKESKRQFEANERLLKQDTCPVCHQQISNAKAKSNLVGLKIQISNYEDQLDLAKEDIEMCKRHMVDENLKIDRLITRIDEAKSVELSAKVVREAITRIKDEIKELKEDENPHEQHLQSRIKALDTMKANIRATIENLDRLTAEHAVTDPWIKGFKRVRLFILEQAFRTLEVEVNNCLAQLGMPDWQITFDIERENKSGGITKGFVVFVKSPANAEPVRWENWSGGESQRLQLAGDLGLANLIMQQNGLVSSIEMFDEPSTHLSIEGMFDLADMLHERAITENKRIWIIDHTSISNFGEFEGVVRVIKDKEGSKIEYKIQ